MDESKSLVVKSGNGSKGVVKVEEKNTGLYDSMLVGTKGKKGVQEDNGVDKNRYVSIAEASAILDRSIYRVRQMQWEGRFGEIKKVEKRVYLEREGVKKVKTELERSRSKNTGLERQRLGKRVVRSCEVMRELVIKDKRVSVEEKKAIIARLDMWSKEGEYLVTNK